MRRLLIAPALAVMFCVAPASAESPTAAPSASPVQPLDRLQWLVGGVWTADASKLGGGMSRIETRYESVADGNLIRFTTAFIDAHENVVNRYAGNFYVDPATARIKTWYLSSKNEITHGDVAIDPATVTLLITEAPEPDAPPQYRVVIAPENGLGSDYHQVYVWKLSARDGDAWKPMFGLTYARPHAIR